MKWTAAAEQVLTLLFEGRWTQAAIAEKCHISPRTLRDWATHPDFKARLDALRADFAASIRDVAYADKARRIVALDQMAEAARTAFETRPWLHEVRPGPRGDITNESFNKDAHAAFREAVADIAAELGQRKQVVADPEAAHIRITIETDTTPTPPTRAGRAGAPGDAD